MQKGDEFSVSFKVSASVYEGFVNVFKDKNPLHTNLSFAQGHGFDSIVMHGNILGGFLSYFIGECLPVKDIIIISQEINYKKPVYFDDNLILKSVISDYFESVSIFEFKYHFENAKGLRVARGKISIKRL